MSYTFSNAGRQSPTYDSITAAMKALGQPPKPLYVQCLPFAWEHVIVKRWRRIDRVSYRLVNIVVRIPNHDLNDKCLMFTGEYNVTAYCGATAYAELVKRCPEVATMKNPHPGGIDQREFRYIPMPIEPPEIKRWRIYESWTVVWGQTRADNGDYYIVKGRE